MKRLRRWFESLFIPSETLETLKTEHNYLEVVRKGTRTVLNSRQTNYSYGGLHMVFRQAFEKTGLSCEQISKVLILGFGAGSIASILHKEMNCNCSITGVEIDPEVIALAKKYFGIEESEKLRIVNDDALHYVSRCDGQYDLIVIDLFVDHKIPECFDSKAFLREVKRLLLPQGRVYYNRLCYDHDSKKRTARFEKVFSEVFPRTGKTEIRKYSKNIVFTGACSPR